jgi:hypothetical protein
MFQYGDFSAQGIFGTMEILAQDISAPEPETNRETLGISFS